ncbi:MAG: hypothetical protein AB7F59_04070 [Bdellovibrionales bacterium]
MSIQELDFYFPFIVFAYGILMTLVLNSPLVSKAEHLFPEAILQQFKANRILGFICLFVGGFWALQNLIFS